MYQAYNQQLVQSNERLNELQAFLDRLETANSSKVKISAMRKVVDTVKSEIVELTIKRDSALQSIINKEKKS